jgi:DNA repair ATPase RecN
MACEDNLAQCEKRLKEVEEINNKVGQSLVRIMVHCAKMNDRIETLEKEGKDVSLVRELITQVMTEIGP